MLNKMLTFLVGHLFAAYCFLLGYRCKRGTDPEFLKAAYIFRNDVFLNDGILSRKPENITVSTENLAACLQVSHRGELAGSVCLWDLSEQRPFQDCTFPDLPEIAPDLRDHFEIMTFAVAPEHRSGNQLVFLLLVWMAYRYSREAGVEYWLAGSRLELLRAIRRITTDVKTLSDNPGISTSKNIKCNYYNSFSEEFISSKVCYSIHLAGFDILRMAKHLINKTVKQWTRKRFS